MRVVSSECTTFPLLLSSYSFPIEFKHIHLDWLFPSFFNTEVCCHIFVTHITKIVNEFLFAILMILIIDIDIEACWFSIINKYTINLPIRESLPLWKTSKESWTSKGRWQNSWAHFLLETNNILKERGREESTRTAKMTYNLSSTNSKERIR